MNNYSMLEILEQKIKEAREIAIKEPKRIDLKIELMNEVDKLYGVVMSLSRMVSILREEIEKSPENKKYREDYLKALKEIEECGIEKYCRYKDSFIKKDSGTIMYSKVEFVGNK